MTAAQAMDPWATGDVSRDVPDNMTTVRIHFLSCGHVAWIAHPVSPPCTINYCTTCRDTAAVEHYIDEQARDA
jgi:hypothetical protein